MSDDAECGAIRGHLDFPKAWTVFAPFGRDSLVPDADALASIPQRMIIGDETASAATVASVDGQVDLRDFLGAPLNDEAFGKVAFVFVPLQVKEETVVTLGIGGDHQVQVWLNAAPVLGVEGPVDSGSFPPSIHDFQVEVRLRAGVNVLAVRLIAGKSSSVLALGGPDELRAGPGRSILVDPMRQDARWTKPHLRAGAGSKSLVEIGSRRELFVDDHLIDTLTGNAERRLHHPSPRNVAFVPDQPWEGTTAGYYTLIAVDGRYRLYYSGRPDGQIETGDRGASQFACVAESDDAITFTRPQLGIVEYNGSRANNILLGGAPGHNFTPFLDANPEARSERRFKAIAYHPSGARALGVYASPDGYDWSLLHDEPAITQGNFDSQNVAFWDSQLACYVCYCRINTGGLRRIQRCTSPDFITWSKPVEISYSDNHQTQMYTNGIAPYFRAPHIYMGLAARYVPVRTKVAAHPHPGISDAILIAGRDGQQFERWEEGFIRPGSEPEVWTDRNNYPAWGIVRTAPHQLSLYWTEHNRHQSRRLRRGTLRLDGFASLHAGGREVGEMLSRPLTFTGRRLVVNYATSAVGSIRFELCHVDGRPVDGLSLEDSDVLFGNEVDAEVCWRRGPDIGAVEGRPVRVRVRLHDADLYALRFSERARRRAEQLANDADLRTTAPKTGMDDSPAGVNRTRSDLPPRRPPHRH